jgi:hypothetical protein
MMSEKTDDPVIYPQIDFFADESEKKVINQITCN